MLRKTTSFFTESQWFDEQLWCWQSRGLAQSCSIAERSRAAFAAGCDVVLHCNGDMSEMIAVASESPELSGSAAKRADAALAARGGPQDFDTEAARRTFAQMLADGPQPKAWS